MKGLFASRSLNEGYRSAKEWNLSWTISGANAKLMVVTEELDNESGPKSNRQSALFLLSLSQKRAKEEISRSETNPEFENKIATFNE